MGHVLSCQASQSDNGMPVPSRFIFPPNIEQPGDPGGAPLPHRSIQNRHTDKSLTTKVFPVERRGPQQRDLTPPGSPCSCCCTSSHRTVRVASNPGSMWNLCGILGAIPFRKLPRWRAPEFNGRSPVRRAGNGRRVVDVPAGLDVRLVALSQKEIANQVTSLETAVHWDRRLAGEIWHRLALPEVPSVIPDISTRVPNTRVCHWCKLGSHTGDLRHFGGLPNAV